MKHTSVYQESLSLIAHMTCINKLRQGPSIQGHLGIQMLNRIFDKQRNRVFCHMKAFNLF